MPAKSPLDDITDGPIKLSVNINGSPIKDDYAIKSIQVIHEINKISYAQIVLIGEVNPDDNSMPITDSDDFNPGNAISILAGYERSEPQNIFNGLVVDHYVEVRSETGFSFRIICKHAAVGMVYNQPGAKFLDKSDSDIISAITSDYGLNASVDSTTYQHKVVQQRMLSDWDLILSRCDHNGFIVCMDGETLHIGKPDFFTSAVLRIAMGDSIISFKGKISAEFQPPSVKTSTWDVTTQMFISAGSREPDLNQQGNIKPRELSKTFNQKELNPVATAPLNQDQLTMWSNAELLWQRLNAIKGTVKIIGNATVKTGNIIELDGVGKKFNGNAFVSAVMHFIEEGIWHSTLTFGLGRSPVRSDFNELIEEKDLKLPTPAKSSTWVSFDEEKNIISLKTPGNNSIVISDDDKGIKITDQNGNAIILSPDGIALNSAKDISLKASGKISLNAYQKISVKSEGDDVQVSGLNISNEALIGFIGKGSATAELSAGTETIVKGAIVMIN